MRRRRTVLFLQLPQLDNEIRGRHETPALAAAYLAHALDAGPESRHVETAVLPLDADGPGDEALAAHLATLAPDVIAFTLCLWNVERSLHLLRLIRGQRPETIAMAGGPEVDRGNSLLARLDGFDVLVQGEGEPVASAVCRGLRTGRMPPFVSVGRRAGRGWRWGTEPAPRLSLRQCLPQARDPRLAPDAAGMAYVEATRGCPLACAYCRYHHQRAGLTSLPPAEVVRRLAVLHDRGAREIRFIDPTFNAHPAFHDLVAAIARFNRRRRLKFFAELRADRLTDDDARQLARAGFTDIEVGVQDIHEHVTRAIHRPSDIAAATRGIGALASNGVRVTLDLMYGLPGQTLDDFRRSLDWALRFRRTTVQCLQTLLIPGTELRGNSRLDAGRSARGRAGPPDPPRDRHARRGLRALPVPPYAVIETDVLTHEDMVRIEAMIHRRSPSALDCPTARFVGATLPDLFRERVRLRVPDDLGPAAVPGSACRRALVFEGPRLWAWRRDIAAFARKAIRLEPHTLWQFVIAPAWEEPLDVLDALVSEVRRAPSHVLDRWASPRLRGQTASRRVFVKLRAGRRYDPSWVKAAESLLSEAFY